MRNGSLPKRIPGVHNQMHYGATVLFSWYKSEEGLYWSWHSDKPAVSLWGLSFSLLLIRGRCSHLWNTRKPSNKTALSKWSQLYSPFSCGMQSCCEVTINGEDHGPSGDETRHCFIGETTVWSIHCDNAIASLIRETKWPLEWVKHYYEVQCYIFN